MKKVIFCWSSCSLHGLRNDLPFSSERLEIEKFEKPLANLHDKTQYVIHIRNLKQALNYGSVLKKKPRIIKLNQQAWLKLYIDIKTDLRIKAKNDFEKNAIFGKIWKMQENIEILDLSQKKKEETIWCIILLRFSQKIYQQYKQEKRRYL